MRTPVWDKADAETRAAFEELVEQLGEQAQPVDLPDAYAAAWDDQRAIMAADMAHNLKRAGRARRRGLEQDACAISWPKAAR